MTNIEVLLGKYVYIEDDDEPIGQLKDVIINVDGASIHSMVIDYRHFFHTLKLLMYKDLKHVKNHRVIIDDVTQLVPMKKDSGFLDFARFTKLNEIEVYDSNKKLVGFFKDMYYDETNGSVLAYIISNGFIDDLTNGLMVVRDVNKIDYQKTKLKITTPIEECSIDILGGLKNLLEL